MTSALYTFKLTKTIFNYGDVNYLMNPRLKKKITYSDLTVQSTKWWQEIISLPRKVSSGVKQCLDNLTAHSLLQLLASSLISMETRKIVFFFLCLLICRCQNISEESTGPLFMHLIPLAVAWSLWPTWIPYVYPKRQWGFWLLYSLNSLLEGNTGWELTWGTFELFFKEAGHSS